MSIDDEHTRATDAAEPPASTTGPDPTAPTSRAALPHWVSWAAVAVISVVAIWYWRGFLVEGHNGGDDFALYIDQARALLQGDVGQTLGNAHFTVANSAWHTFSPFAYGWGLPLMLAPVMAITGTVDPVTGIDYGPLKMVIVASFLVAMLAYGAILWRRVSGAGPILLPLFFATNFVFVLHLDNVLSEIPFMMALMLFVLAYDRIRESDGILGPRIWPLVGLGLLACFAFNIRREGLGVVAGLALGQLAEIEAVSGSGGLRWRTDWRERVGRIRQLRWQPVAAPWLTFAGAATFVHLTLPSDIAPHFDERDPAAVSGLWRITDNLRIYRPLFAEQLGIKDLGPADITAFGSPAAGQVVFWLVVGGAVLGMVLAAVKRPRVDLPLLGVFLGVSFWVLVAPFQTYRYIMALLPFMLYFAYQAIAIPLGAIRWRPLARAFVVADLAVLAFIVGGWHDTANARDYRSHWVGPQPGPQQLDSLEMFTAVRQLTRGDSVIVTGRARLMTLYTGRRAVQGGSIDFITPSGDYYAMYLNPDGTPGDYTQYPLTDAEAAERGFTEVWRNEGWVLWRNPPVGFDASLP